MRFILILNDKNKRLYEVVIFLNIFGIIRANIQIIFVYEKKERVFKEIISKPYGRKRFLGVKCKKIVFILII